MLISETWKSVSEVKDKFHLILDDDKDYQVSNLGNFRIVDSEGNVKNGHITISESQASVTIGKRQILLHRLVALLFLKNDNPELNTVVIYKDGDHTNNCAENLLWVSASERNERRYIHQRSTKNIRCIDEDRTFASSTSASLYYNIPTDIIKNAIYHQSVCFGHKFEYADKSTGSILYLSIRKAKSLSSMLKDPKELRSYFEEIRI